MFRRLLVSNVSDFNTRNQILTTWLLKQGIRYHKIRKAFSKLYHRHSELIVKYNIGSKLFCISAYQNQYLYFMVILSLNYKFKVFFGKPNLSDQFKKNNQTL